MARKIIGYALINMSGYVETGTLRANADGTPSAEAENTLALYRGKGGDFVLSPIFLPERDTRVVSRRNQCR